MGLEVGCGDPAAGELAAFGGCSVGAAGWADSGGDTTAAIVPPKIVTRPIATRAIMPVATTELVLTDTRGSIQSGR